VFPSNIKILIIDDFPSMRSIIKKEFNKLGFTQIDEAGGAKHARSKIKAALELKEPYGVIVAEWVSPDAKGVDLLRFCQSNDCLENTVFLMLTSEVEQRSNINSINLGITEYISKPIDSDKLKLKIENLWERFHKKAAS
jgi:two-component system chemotaxis response regulator CheY